MPYQKAKPAHEKHYKLTRPAMFARQLLPKADKPNQKESQYLRLWPVYRVLTFSSWVYSWKHSFSDTAISCWAPDRTLLTDAWSTMCSSSSCITLFNIYIKNIYDLLYVFCYLVLLCWKCYGTKSQNTLETQPHGVAPPAEPCSLRYNPLFVLHQHLYILFVVNIQWKLIMHLPCVSKHWIIQT